jgi:hypothetical protein
MVKKRKEEEEKRKKETEQLTKLTASLEEKSTNVKRLELETQELIHDIRERGTLHLHPHPHTNEEKQQKELMDSIKESQQVHTHHSLSSAIS